MSARVSSIDRRHVRPGRLARAGSAWRRFWFAPAGPEALAICRFLFFAYLLLRLAPEVTTAAWSSVTPALWIPIHLFAWLHLGPAPSGALVVLHGLWVGALLLACLGLFTRASTWVALVLGTYLLGLPQCFGKIDHWSGLLLMVMGVLALARSGDAFSVDAWLRARRSGDAAGVAPSGEYRWPIQVVRLTMALVFFAAGVAKLRFGGAAWFDPGNMASILVQPHYALDRSLPDLGLWMARSPVVCGLLAAGTVAAEFLAPLALLGGLPAAAIVGTLFLMQLGNAELLGVHASFPYLACYAFWLPWADLVAWIGRRDGARRPTFGISGPLGNP